MSARVKRGKGPTSTMTKATYRKKALPHLLTDFEKRCAYCIDPNDFRHPTQDQIDHFNCKLKERLRHQYNNLMLACAACNRTKHDKPIVNPYDKAQRMLNCTEENEFVEHIVEQENGQWEGKTDAGIYHLETIGLREECHRKKREARKKLAERIVKLYTTAVEFKSANPAETLQQLKGTISDILDTLDSFPPLVTAGGMIPVREWLRGQGIDPTT